MDEAKTPVNLGKFWLRGYRVQGSGFKVQGTRFRVQGARCKVQGARCKVQGSGFMVMIEFPPSIVHRLSSFVPLPLFASSLLASSLRSSQ
jgi:hypothetical protein